MLVVIVASAILFLLVVAAHGRSGSPGGAAAARELALRHAGVARAAAVGRASVNDGRRLDRAVVGPTAKVRLVLWTPDGAEVAASSGDRRGADVCVRPRTGCRCERSPRHHAVVASPSEQSLVELDLGDEASIARLRSPSATRTRRDRRRDAVRTRPRRDLFDSLEALASQVSLALEAASLAENLHRQKSEARFRSLVAHASDLITVLDADGVVTYQSPSIERILGYAVEEIEGQRFDRLLADADRSRLEQVAGRSSAGGAPRRTRFDCSLRHRDGRWLQFEVQHTHLLHDEHVRGIVLNSRDVSERKAFEDQLAHQAFHDPVTDLANRALFADRVEHALRSHGSQRRADRRHVHRPRRLQDRQRQPRARRPATPILQEVARRLERGGPPRRHGRALRRRRVRNPARRCPDSQEAAPIAERLLGELEAPIEIDGKQVYPRASVGICISDEDLLSQDAEELLRNADVAMYMAKRDSKGSYRLFEPAMHERVVERLELRAELAAGARARTSWRSTTSRSSTSSSGGGLRRRSAPALEPPDPRPDPARCSSSRWPRRPA